MLLANVYEIDADSSQNRASPSKRLSGRPPPSKWVLLQRLSKKSLRRLEDEASHYLVVPWGRLGQRRLSGRRRRD
jgi:hypothetical protein